MTAFDSTGQPTSAPAPSEDGAGKRSSGPAISRQPPAASKRVGRGRKAAKPPPVTTAGTTIDAVGPVGAAGQLTQAPNPSSSAPGPLCPTPPAAGPGTDSAAAGATTAGEDAGGAGSASTEPAVFWHVFFLHADADLQMLLENCPCKYCDVTTKQV